jgi:hypothetical protein
MGVKTKARSAAVSKGKTNGKSLATGKIVEKRRLGSVHATRAG